MVRSKQTPVWCIALRAFGTSEGPEGRLIKGQRFRCTRARYEELLNAGIRLKLAPVQETAEQEKRGKRGKRKASVVRKTAEV